MRLRQILVVELLGGLGDLLMMLPSIHALAASHPTAQLSVFTFRPAAELLEGDPRVFRVFPATKRDDASGAPVAKEELRRLLAEHNFDLVVSDTNYGGIDQLIEDSGAKHKATRLWHQAGKEERIERVFLRNLLALGYIRPEFADERAHLALKDTEVQWAREWFRATSSVGGRIIMLNTDAGVAVKRWPPEHFIAVGKAFLDHQNTQVWVVADDQMGQATEIAAGIGESARVLPRMPLRRFASLIAQASLFISVDTGPARIAAALGVPTVALFGPTWAGRYGLPPPHLNLQSPFHCDHMQPMNITLQPCWYGGQCVHPGKRTCTEDLDPQLVVKAALELLSRAGAPAEAGPLPFRMLNAADVPTNAAQKR